MSPKQTPGAGQHSTLFPQTVAVAAQQMAPFAHFGVFAGQQSQPHTSPAPAGQQMLGGPELYPVGRQLGRSAAHHQLAFPGAAGQQDQQRRGRPGPGHLCDIAMPVATQLITTATAGMATRAYS